MEKKKEAGAERLGMGLMAEACFGQVSLGVCATGSSKVFHTSSAKELKLVVLISVLLFPHWFVLPGEGTFTTLSTTEESQGMSFLVCEGCPGHPLGQFLPVWGRGRCGGV